MGVAMTVRYFSVRDSAGEQVRQVYDRDDAEAFKAEGFTVVEMVNHYQCAENELGEI